MPVRNPLKYDGSGHLIEMNATDIANIKTEMIRLYGVSPSVTLSVVASGGNLGTINDTRYQAGAFLTSITNYPAETSTAEPSQITVGYSRINEAVATLSAPADTNNRAFPVYLTASGHIQSMTLLDMYDTFVTDVINTLTTASPLGTGQAGTYTIHTATTLAGATLVSATPVFSDTRADLTLYSAAGIPETLDQPVTITDYYLFSINPATVGTVPIPVYLTAGDHLQQFALADFQTLLTNIVDYYATQTGSRIDYVLDTSTTGARGSGIANTDHTGVTGDYQILFVNTNDYRAQEFPNGTPATITTTYLRCVRA